MENTNAIALERHGVVSHPHGRTEIATVGRFEVKLDTLDDGDAFEDGWIDKSDLWTVLDQDEVRYRPPDCDDPDKAFTEVQKK